ncbi:MULTISPECIES: hypothetical protein [unclassified Serratia (in: enterobacteria)]|jgi:hypothetical protein|uniref:hypothetical protein n=1 Tax=unclassified Serratia (in: enterobacteria) TaxID=2647522 RepID=UPI0030764A94
MTGHNGRLSLDITPAGGRIKFVEKVFCGGVNLTFFTGTVTHASPSGVIFLALGKQFYANLQPVRQTTQQPAVKNAGILTTAGHQ